MASRSALSQAWVPEKSGRSAMSEDIEIETGFCGWIWRDRVRVLGLAEKILSRACVAYRQRGTRGSSEGVNEKSLQVHGSYPRYPHVA